MNLIQIHADKTEQSSVNWAIVDQKGSTEVKYRVSRRLGTSD